MLKVFSSLVVLAGAIVFAPVWGGDFDRQSLIDADYKQGRTAFQQRCSACHTLAEGGSNLVGPNLYGVFGGEAGTKANFAYSDAMISADFDWTPANVGEFMANPLAKVPNTKMIIPEGVPEADRAAVVSFMMLETGGADWARPEIEEELLPEGASIAEKYPSFWNHMMNNTTHYRMVTAEGEYEFDAYFNKDGSVSSNTKVTGFWHVDERDFFCYALHRIPLKPKQFIECFPIVAMSIPRFSQELWQSKPAAGLTLHGGILPGRP